MVKQEIPIPFQFNPLKHHLSFIKQYIHEYSTKPLFNLKKDLSIIGGSQMDVYYGKLTIDEIISELKDSLGSMKCLKEETLAQCLKSQGHFLKLRIRDESEWVITKSSNKDRYIHIHPGRHSPNTLRIKSSTLKTFIATKIACGMDNPDLATLNFVRTHHLGLSPVSKLNPQLGLGKRVIPFCFIY